MKPPSNAPVYAGMYKGLAEITRKHGYALAVHGSLDRDMDLIAVPWIESPSSPDEVLKAITETFAIRTVGELTSKPHGRLCQTIVISSGDVFIDLSFMPVMTR